MPVGLALAGAAAGGLALARKHKAFSKLFDPKGLGAANTAYVAAQQQKRADGTLGMSDAQKDATVARGQEQVGAATQAALSQVPMAGVDAGTQQRMFQSAAGGMQQALAQQKMGADLESQQQAANASAELNALEQGAFARRQKNRDFAVDAAGKAVEVANVIAKDAALCWVAIALWGETDPRTRLARLWCAENPSHPFVRLYRAHGQTWARWVKSSVVARALAWPLWRLLAWRGEQHLLAEMEPRRG